MSKDNENTIDLRTWSSDYHYGIDPKPKSCFETKISNAKIIEFSPSSHHTIQDIYSKRPDMFSTSKVHIYYTERKYFQIWEGNLVDLAHNFDDMYREHDVERFECFDQYSPHEFAFILRTPTCEKKKHDDSPDNLYEQKKKITLNYHYGIDPLPFDPISEHLEIKETIVNGPATIIFWSDGTKTVVKCDKDDVLDYEKGILYAALKKLCNKKEYDIILREIDSWNEFNNLYPDLFPDRVEKDRR